MRVISEAILCMEAIEEVMVLLAVMALMDVIIFIKHIQIQGIIKLLTAKIIIL